MSKVYWDALRRLLENMQRLRSQLLQQMNWLLDNDNTIKFFPFTREFFDQRQHDCLPPPIPLYLAWPLAIFAHFTYHFETV
jgi:hypothetical protein